MENHEKNSFEKFQSLGSNNAREREREREKSHRPESLRSLSLTHTECVGVIQSCNTVPKGTKFVGTLLKFKIEKM